MGSAFKDPQLGVVSMSSQGASDPRWQEAWLALQRRPWSSLVLVPASPDLDVVAVAQRLLEVGQMATDKRIEVVDVRALLLENSQTRAQELKTKSANGLVLAVTDPPSESVAAVVYAQSADAVLLCARLGETRLADAKTAVERIGHPRFVGVLVVE